MVARWFVAQVIPRCEPWVIESALRGGFEGFWPRFELIRRRGAGSKYYKGVFPGYMFLSFDTDDDDWRRVCRINGLRRILGANEHGARSLPLGFVENMIEAAPSGIIDMPDVGGIKFNYGDKLKITEGPMAGRVGIFQHSEKDRVAILLSLLGRETRIILPLSSVQHVSAFS